MKFVFLGILLIATSACSAFNRRADKNDKTIEAPMADVEARDDIPSIPPPQSNPVDESQPLTDGIASPVVETPAPEEETVDVTLTKKSYIDQKHHEPKTDIIPANSERTETTFTSKPGVDAEKALSWLKNGNKRFLKGAFRADGQSKKDVTRLAAAETPHAVVFSSSDSRIPPEIIFDEKLGEIYVIRNLGLTVDNSVLNSIDYAIGTLGVKLLVVLDRTYPDKGTDFSHADATAQKLVDSSSVLKAALDSGTVKIVPSVYDISSGKVIFGK
jgi:carbonic anhydrase